MSMEKEQRYLAETGAMIMEDVLRVGEMPERLKDLLESWIRAARQPFRLDVAVRLRCDVEFFRRDWKLL